MAIEKDSIYREREQIGQTAVEDMGVVDVDVMSNNTGDVTMLEDGSAVIGDQQMEQEIEFGSNLAEFMDENDLNIVSNEVMEGFEEDKASRKEWEETYKKGLGLLEIDGKKTKVKENDTILIEANQSQRITNIGKCDLEFYCICTPRFYPECYISHEI